MSEQALRQAHGGRVRPNDGGRVDPSGVGDRSDRDISDHGNAGGHGDSAPGALSSALSGETCGASQAVPAPKPAGERRLAWGAVLLGLAVLALAALWLIASDPLRVFQSAAPPVEEITFERVILDDAGIALKVRAGGSAPITIAQVQVDGAYWHFVQTPPGPLPRLAGAWLRIPYPWVLGETHRVTLLTATGLTFTHEIAVALPTPVATTGGLWAGAVVGLFVGVLPVAIGLMFYPLIRGFTGAGMRFVLALTLGLLAFLLVDMLIEALELAGKAARAFQGPVLVIITAALSALALIAVGRQRGVPEGLTLAGFMALGIGLHNFGEGLAIGAALASGAAGLGAFLVLGFTLHNVTEGIGIAAPLVRARPTLLAFAGLTALAGLPAVLGIWLGASVIAPQWAALALAVGAGAILQVLFEVGGFMHRHHGGRSGLLDRASLSGFAIAFAFLYLTAMLIKI